ncbi:MAG TPA: PPOX class F420-dependent oxidoreductase [Chloroflexia bacterium]|nr:PPOX class F420-dependent oxidoreductase [Chloroflexia bacterium]
MSVFTQAEIEYLKSQRLGRLATVSEAGDPHVVPCRFRYNEELDVLEVGGKNMGKSKKFRDATGNSRVAFVVDDAPEPGRPRGIEVRGSAEVVLSGGEQIMPGWDPEFLRITPTHVAAWGVDGDPFRPLGRKAERADT